MAESPTTSHRPDILPGERLHSVTRGRLATVVVVAVAIVVLANTGVAELIKRVPVNRGYALALGKWTLLDKAIATKRKLDVLIVGDSSANQGLNPAVIRKMTGERSMNFGVVAEATPAEPVWTVRQWFENTPKKTRPNDVLWMHVYDVWSRPDPGNRHLLAISTAMPPSVWPQIIKGPPVRFTIEELRWRRLTPLWSQNASMQLLIRRPLASLAEASRFRFDDTGFTAETIGEPDRVARDTKNHMKLARTGEIVTPNRFSNRALAAMASLARRYEFNLWIVESPLNESLWLDPVFRDRWFTVHSALKAFAAKNERVHVVFDEPMTFADSRMQNCDHVLADAADEFTARVMERVDAVRNATTRPTTQP